MLFFQVPEPNKFEAEFYRQASKKNLDAGSGSGGGMGSVCSNSISSLGLSSHGSLNLSPLPNILQVRSESNLLNNGTHLTQNLQGFQQQHENQEDDRESRQDSQTPVDTALSKGDANIVIVSGSPMIAKPAIKRKSSSGSLKGGAPQPNANGIGNGNGGGRQGQSLVEQVDVVRAYSGQQRPAVGVPVEFQRHSQALLAHHPVPARKRGGSMQYNNSIQQQHPNALKTQRQQHANQSHTLPTRQQQRALRQDPSFHLRQLHPHHQQQHGRRHHQGFASRTLPSSTSKRERSLTVAAAGHQCTCSSASSSSHASPSKANRPRSLEFANGTTMPAAAALYPPMSANAVRPHTVDFDDSSSAMSGLNYGSSSDAGPQTPETAMAPVIGATAR